MSAAASNCTVAATAAPIVSALTVLTVMRQALTSDRGYTSNTSAVTAASGWWAFGDAETTGTSAILWTSTKVARDTKGATKHTGARLALRKWCLSAMQMVTLRH